MIEKLLHTPEGVRDIYNDECEKKNVLNSNLYKILKSYGFKDIQTPTFEFFDIFNKERGTVASKNMYKFFDREGNTLVLRPDMTPAIARCVAKYYKDENMPIRLCYVGNTYINNSSYQGKLKEKTQLGAELINDETVDADAEMIALTVECLLSVGLKEFQVEIGHAEFFKGLTEEAGFSEEETEKFKSLLEKKNLFGVEGLISSKNIDNNLKEILLKLPELFGSLDEIIYIKDKVKNQMSLNAIERLEKLYKFLKLYKLEQYITFDLGIVSQYGYYTGIVFKAYTYGNGDSIVDGGRYDNLISQFGKDTTGVGLAISIDQLMTAMSRQKIDIDIQKDNMLILYHSTQRESAILLANKYRNDGINTELLRKTSKKEISEYIEYGKRIGIKYIFYINENRKVQLIDIQTNDIKYKDLEEF